LARSLTAADIPKQLLFAKKLSLATRFQILLLILQYSVSSRPRFLQHMLQGATLVWLHWFLLTTVSARFLLPVLVIALCIISASLVTDLMLAALAFVLATVGAAVAGIVVGGVTEGRRQFPRALVYGGMSLTPYLTLIGLIARAEHGVIVAPAVVTGLVARPFIWRLARRTRAALRHAH
jgi:hypothetical protein